MAFERQKQHILAILRQKKGKGKEQKKTRPELVVLFWVKNYTFPPILSTSLPKTKAEKEALAFFIFFLLGEREKKGGRPGGVGGDEFSWKIPGGGGGFPGGWGQGGDGQGGCLRGIWGGGGHLFFFSGPKFTPRYCDAISTRN